MRLIVGLGNPGRTYGRTRHNAGFMVIDRLADEFGIEVRKKKFNTCFGKGIIAGQAALLAKPQAFMNNSGPPVKQVADYHNIASKDLLVIHDDIDLEYGRVKIKEKGGHGGHNGLRSLMGSFGSGDFARVRIGIGRSATGREVTDHVLGGYTTDEKKVLSKILERSCDAVIAILKDGIRSAMNQFNDKRLKIAD